nr:hypothetical protein [uncultured Mediterraneibacter sp.]
MRKTKKFEVKNLRSTGKYNISVERDGRWKKEYENALLMIVPPLTTSSSQTQSTTNNRLPSTDKTKG